MEPFSFALLLSMQAAGMIFDFIGTQNQQRLAEMGQKAQQAGIEANIAQTRLESEQQSYSAMVDLRKNIGSQIATYAARGTALGAGSVIPSIFETIGNFNADERTRRINLLGKENELRGGAALNRLQYQSDTSKMWQGFATRTVNRFPSSYSGWKEYLGGAKDAIGLTTRSA